MIKMRIFPAGEDYITDNLLVPEAEMKSAEEQDVCAEP